jgi:hypothetical protein
MRFVGRASPTLARVAVSTAQPPRRSQNRWRRINTRGPLATWVWATPGPQNRVIRRDSQCVQVNVESSYSYPETPDTYTFPLRGKGF